MIRSASSPSIYIPGALRGAEARPRRADWSLTFTRLRGRRLGAAVDPGTVDSIAQAIQTREGYYPGSLAYRNNNPGNLVYAGQPGATPGAGGFAAFSSYTAGYSALENQINLDFTRGTDVNGKPINTVADLINSWAPPSENDTAGYIAAVSAQTGLDPDASLYSPGSGDGGTDASFSFDAGPGIDLSSAVLSSSVSPWWLAAGLLATLVIVR